ncbi:PspA/IM30 family protein [Kaarinaea lacus]
MSDSIATRVGRIISGSFNALVDAIENAVPETVMEEAIREIDLAIDDVRAELGRIVANKHLANKRLSDEHGKLDTLNEQIELAVTQSRDDLAEAAIAKQLDIEAQIPVLETTISEASQHEKELEGFIQALQAKKREMQEELKQFKASRTTAASTSGTGIANNRSSSVESRVDKAGSAFERVLENATGISGVSNTTQRKTAAQLAELEELARNNRIKERLAAIKSKAGT